MTFQFAQRLVRRRGIQDLGWLFSSSGISQGLGLLSTILMARYFEQAALGEFFLIMSWMGALAGWGLPGLSSALVTSITRQEEGTYRRAVIMESLCALGGSFCLLAIGWWQTQSQDYLHFWVYAVSAILFPLSLNDCGWQVLAGQRRYRESATLQLVASTISLAWLGLCIMINIGISWFFIGNLAFSSFVNGLLIVRNWGRVGNPDSYSSETIRYGLHLTFSNILTQPLGQLERLLVGLYFGASDLAVFGLGEMVFSQLRVLGNQSHAIYFPRIAQLSWAQAYQYLRRQAAMWTLGFGLLAIGLLFIFPWLYPIVFGEKYVASASFAGWYSVMFVLGVPSFFFTIYFRHIRATKATYLYGLIRVLLQLGCLALGFALFGLIGLPIARGMTLILYEISGWVLLKRLLEPGLRLERKDNNVSLLACSPHLTEPKQNLMDIQ